MSATFKTGETVIYVNANNVACIGTVVKQVYDDYEKCERVEIEYRADGHTYNVSPHLERVGRIGDQLASVMAKALCPNGK